MPPVNVLEAAKKAAEAKALQLPQSAAPTSTPGNEAYSNWQEEYNWAIPQMKAHVQSKPFLYGKVQDSDYENAFQIYNEFRQQLPNKGDAYNATLDKLGWWTGQPTYNAPSGGASPQQSGGYTASGNWQADLMKIASQYAPSAKNFEQLVFPAFSQMYPGFQMKRNASGYVDSIIAPDGQIWDTQQDSGWDYSKAWHLNLAGGPGFQESGSPFQTPYTGGMPSFNGKTQFTDPLTKQYEQMLQSQTAIYKQQQAQMQAEALRQQQVRAQTDEQVKRLMEFINQRVNRLGQPAYTDSEAEVLRTRALDPIERDRTAANQRALQNIGARGFDPSSGIAQDLLRQVNQGFDESRAGAQNDLAYRQIQEQRSRDQEKQQLLTYLSQLPLAAAKGDLGFLEYLNSAINKPGQDAMAATALLSDLPVQRTNLALQTLGLGGPPQSSLPGVMALLQNAQQNKFLTQSQQSNFWNNLGQNFMV